MTRFLEISPPILMNKSWSKISITSDNPNATYLTLLWALWLLTDGLASWDAGTSADYSNGFDALILVTDSSYSVIDPPGHSFVDATDVSRPSQRESVAFSMIGMNTHFDALITSVVMMSKSAVIVNIMHAICLLSKRKHQYFIAH